MADKSAENLPPVILPIWLTEKRVLVAWIASFGILLLLGFFIFVPVVVTMIDTEGNCFLYADRQDFGPYSVCSYCVTTAVIFLCICGFRLILLSLKVANFSTRVTDTMALWFSVWSVHLVILCLDVILLVFLLVISCLLSVGLSMMCHDVFRGRDKCSSEYGVKLPNEDINTTFYVALTIAEGSAWFTFCYWLIIVLLETFLVWKSGSFEKVISRMKSFVHRDAAAHV